MAVRPGRYYGTIASSITGHHIRCPPGCVSRGKQAAADLSAPSEAVGAVAGLQHLPVAADTLLVDSAQTDRPVSGAPGDLPVSDADARAARQIGAEYVRRFRNGARWIVLVGVVVTVGGFAGFGIYGNRNQQLQRTGLRAIALVTGIAPYPEYRFTEHIDILFTDQHAQVRRAAIPIGENDTYQLGQRIQIAYDAADPARVVLAQGHADIGVVGFPLFGALVIGLIAIVIGASRLRMCRRAGTSLREGAQSMTATTDLLPRGRARACAITLSDRDGDAHRFWAPTKRRWYPLDEPIHAVVFGRASPRAVVLVVDSQRRLATIGRIWRSPRRR